MEFGEVKELLIIEQLENKQIVLFLLLIYKEMEKEIFLMLKVFLSLEMKNFFSQLGREHGEGKNLACLSLLPSCLSLWFLYVCMIQDMLNYLDNAHWSNKSNKGRRNMVRRCAYSMEPYEEFPLYEESALIIRNI